MRLAELPLSPNGEAGTARHCRRRRSIPTPRAANLELPQSETEIKVAAIWAGILKLDKVGRHDNFFDLGGHSLMAARAVALMNQEFGTSLPIRILFQANTVSQLAEAIGKEGAVKEEEWPSLIPIQTRGSRLPLFCVARPNVNALGYLMLSRELGSDQPVYGLQVQLEEDPDLDFSDEQYRNTASEYIRAMKTVQAHGPYNLIGQCQGAYIAYEMVQQLERSGEEVVFLGILDAWTEENTRRKWAFYIYLMLKRMRNLDGRQLKKALNRVRSKIFSRGASNLQKASQQAASRQKKTTLMAKYFPGKDFVPPVCSCPITVLRVKEQAWHRKKDLTHGWSDRTRSGVTVRTVPGNHTTLTRQPHVQVLAATIAARLAESGSRAGELLQFADAG